MLLPDSCCTRSPGRLARLILAGLLWLGSPLAVAGEAETGLAALAEQLASARQSVTAGPESSHRGELLALLDSAEQARAEATRLLDEAAELRRLVQQGEAQVRQLEQQLQRLPAIDAGALRRELDRQRDLATLVRQLEAERTEVAQQQAELARLAAELARSDTRPLSLAEELASQRQRVEQLRGGLPEPLRSGDTVDGDLARRLLAEASLRRAEARLARLQAEQSALPWQRRRLELQQTLLQRQLALGEQRLGALRERVQQRSDADFETLRAKLSEQAASAASAGLPPLQQAAASNLALGEELLQLVSETEAAELRRRLARQASSDAEAALSTAQARLAYGGSEGLGLMLGELRQRLEAPARLLREIDDLRRGATAARLRALELGEQRRALEQRERELERLLGRFDPEPEHDPEALASALDRLLQTRAELLPRLEQAQLSLANALDELEQDLQQQHRLTAELVALLDRHLLWTRSHERIDLDWWRRLPAGAADLVKPGRYQTSLGLLAQELAERPLALLFWLLLLGLLLALRWRAPAWLEARTQPLRQVRDDRYRYTGQALAISLLASLPWPVLLWGLGWLLQQAGEPGRFSDSLGHAVRVLAGGVWMVELLAWLARERGLGHAHFRWPRARREAIRASLPTLRYGLLPLLLIMALSLVRGQEPAVDTAARLALLAFCLVAAGLVWRLLAAGALWTFRHREQVEPARGRRLLSFGLLGFLFGCAGLAANGYLLSAGVLLGALWASVGVLLAVAILYGMLARWFLLGERRLVARQLELRAHESSEGRGDEASSAAEVERMAVAGVNQQSRRLLRAVTLTCAALGLLAVWSDVLPAFGRLGEIALWQYSSVDAEGQPLQAVVSLRELALGLLLLALTWVGARNLPALVEIALASAIHLDAPTRYAITSLLRYLIVILGSIAGLSMFGLRWSQLQWMAAALSVGLGFGLQEIFANFVSGLIVLFERPFRIGDVITIDNQTGTVSRIRTRATTIVDFDGKEVVIPNKTFITGQLVNWTLSDTRTRVVIAVGVAYGSDPAQVHRWLLQAAEEHPLVLKEPLPRSWFMAFGPSSLDFELRVFVDTIQDRLRVQSELNARVAELFAAAGIEIAFPQLDVHLHRRPSSGG